MKKKAFTLTELLVVVVIIGVLAAVVLPKFAHVLEARKTTEAENIMQAIRSEQEARCTLDKDYTAQTAQLASFPANRGNNYSYTLSASGMSAAKADNSYVLHMAYRDGKICCQGAACEGLGKYERCTDAYIDKIQKATDECAAKDVPFEPEPEPALCTEGETRNVVKNCAGTKGERCEGGAWEPFTSIEGGTSQPGNTTQTCSTGETVTCSYTCNTTTGAWDKTCEECPTCTEGEEQITSSKCGKKSGKRCVSNAWVPFTNEETNLTASEIANCTCETQPEDEEQACAEGEGTQTRSYKCNSSTGKYEAGAWEGECTPEEEPEECTPSSDEITWYDGVTDTCDGDETVQYICPNEKKTCVDIYASGGSGGRTQQGCNCSPSCKQNQHCVCRGKRMPDGSIQYFGGHCEFTEGGQTGAIGDQTIVTQSMIRIEEVTCCPAE